MTELKENAVAMLLAERDRLKAVNVELLAACKAAEERIRRGCNDPDDKLSDQLRAAIARAEGGAA